MNFVKNNFLFFLIKKTKENFVLENVLTKEKIQPIVVDIEKKEEEENREDIKDIFVIVHGS